MTTTPETPADAQPRFCRCGVNAWTKTEDGFRCTDCGAGPMTPASVDGGPARVHELKCWPGPFQAMVEGRKRHEFRRNDRGFIAGDVLHLREWNNLDETYTGRTLDARVTYKMCGGQFGIPAGYVVMSLAIPPPDEPRPTTARDAALREEGRVQGLEEAAKACESLGTELSSAGDRADWDDREECMAERIRSRKPAQPDTSQGSALDQPAIVVCEDCEEDYSFQCDLCGDRFCGEHATQHKADKCPALAAASQGSALDERGDAAKLKEALEGLLPVAIAGVGFAKPAARREMFSARIQEALKLLHDIENRIEYAPAAPQGSPPRQYCTEGCADYPRCAHASLPPGVLPASLQGSPLPVPDVHIAVGPEAVDEVLAAQGSPLPGAGHRCRDCGAAINEGEAKTFGVCDACWDKAYPKNPRIPLEGGALVGELAEALRREHEKTIDGCPGYGCPVNALLARYDASIPQEGRAAEGAALALVHAQAEDAGLWFVGGTVTEAYLQRALRALHAAVEAEPAIPQEGRTAAQEKRQEAIEVAAVELWREWERQAGRFYEAMGDDNPRLEAIAARVDALAIAFGPPGSEGGS